MTVALLLAAVTATATPARRCAAAEPWTHWQRYSARFITNDGRVVDRTAGDRSTSEGQAYALFFSLVANDKKQFQHVYNWTQNNLAQGSLSENLPAWLWGHAPDGAWKVLDPNSASDADVWTAYALLEAGRLWHEPRYAKAGEALLRNVASHEVQTLPGLGPVLLPGAAGFEVEAGQAWRLNPSYLTLQLFRRFATVQPSGEWDAVVASSIRVLNESATDGIVPDWTLYRLGEGFRQDPVQPAVCSYDAVRVPLWLGMLPADDSLRKEFGPALSALLARWHTDGALPERIACQPPHSGSGAAPPGFAAALLPQAWAVHDTASVAAIEARLAGQLKDGLYGQPPAYYDQNLILFGRGHAVEMFRFAPDGRLEPRWSGACGTR